MLKTKTPLISGGGIYKIYTLDPYRVYIGSTNSFTRRFKEHSAMLRKLKHHNNNLQYFYNNNIELHFEIIREVKDLNSLWHEEYKEMFSNKEICINLSNFTKSVDYRKRKDAYILKDILEIAELYNNGMTCCKISEKLYNTRNKRAKIASLVRGDSFPEYKNLFEYRKYSQEGRQVGNFTICRKYKGLKNEEKLEEIEKDRNFIIEDMYTLTSRDIAKILNISNRTISSFIKNYSVDIDYEKISNLTKEKYKLLYSINIEIYDESGTLLNTFKSKKEVVKNGYSSYGMEKSIKTGNPYKGIIFKIKN